MANRFAIIVCLVGLCFKLASCQGICTPHSRPYSGNPPLPNIPNSFTLDFTIYATINGTTEESLNRLFVDSERKLAVEVRGKDYKYGGQRTIFDQKRKEVLVIKGNTCQVRKFQDYEVNPLTVYDASNFSNGNQFFRISEHFNPTFNGTMPVGSLPVLVWEECIPAVGKSNNYNINVQHLFTNDSKNGMVLFGCRVSANNPQRMMTMAVQNVVPARPPPEMLQVPSDVFCKMSKTDYKIPQVPDEFEMNIEVVMSRNKSGVNVRDYIDTKERYFRSDHHHKENGIWVPVHEIHDFNTGILYEINSRTAECEMKPLTNKSWDSTEGDDHHHIRMRTSEEFFGLNHDDYIYEGQASVRGIQADVFSRIRHSRRHPEKMMIQKWYFSRPDWKIGGIEGPVDDTRVPLMLKFIRNDSTSVMNFFNYDPIETTTHILWPLRVCYKNNRHYIYFRLDGKYDDYGVKDQRSLTKAIRLSLSSAGRVTKLRVSSVLIFKSGYGGVIAVRLYVLGLPSIKGSVQVLNPIHETPLKKAVDGIKKAITTGKLAVRLRTSTLTAQKTSYYDIYVDGPDPSTPKRETKKAGLTRGAVTAIVLSMIILAIVLTIVAVHFVLKRRGVHLFNYSRHSNE